MMNRMKDALKNNLTRVLLFAVVISFGFTLVLSTNAKYLSFMNGHTHAQAGEFYFESTYLEENEVTYTVNSWSRSDYSVLLQFMNYKNALLFNQEGQGFYYTVEANLYNDAQCTQLNNNYTTTVVVDKISSTQFNGKTYYYFPQDQQGEFTTKSRIQEVRVNVKLNEGASKVESKQYLKVVAKTLSSEDLAYYNKTSSAEFITSSYPVFERELSAKFILEYNPNVEVLSELKQSQSSSEVVYRLSYAENLGVSEAKVKVYFDKTKLEIDRTLGLAVTEESDRAGFSCFETEVYSTGMRNIIFFKTKTSDEITETDVYYELIAVN